MKKSYLIIIAVVSTLLSSCGKYDDGPFFSIRSKNSRLEGKWKLVEYKSEWTNALDASDNDSQILSGGIMTSTYYDAIYDPWTGSIIGYEPVTSSYPFEQSMEFKIKDNTCTTTTISSGISDVSTALWSWSDGAHEQELLEIDGQGLIIKRLTNKELELYYEVKEDGATGVVEITLEKE
jgi:hypothetical protein